MEVKEWQRELDQADTEGSPLIEFPKDSLIGDIFKDERSRQWQRVSVVLGAVGGRWAYWAGATRKAETVYPDKNFRVIADKIFNSHTFHFAGMLAIPFNGQPSESWILLNASR